MWLTYINIETSYVSRTIDTQIRQVKIQLCSGPKIPMYFRVPALKRCIQKLWGIRGNGQMQRGHLIISLGFLGLWY